MKAPIVSFFIRKLNAVSQQIDSLVCSSTIHWSKIIADNMFK